jgi:ubiquinone/menaquinone biosynthesis C-methylase UbiE
MQTDILLNLVPDDILNQTTGNGDYLLIANEFFEYFKKFGIKPEHKVLDVGCGLGRMSLPLTQYLKNGKYYGFDIVESEIDWCNSKINYAYPNFNFQHCNIYNKHYNTKGIYAAEEYVFPYDDESFDFIILTSVFTHMMPDELENYLFQIQRVLKKNGTVFATYFLLNKESKQLIDSRNSLIDFKEYRYFGNCEYNIINRDIPEDAIAIDESYIFNLYAKYGLAVNNCVKYGAWCNRKKYLSYQDIVVAKKQV